MEDSVELSGFTNSNCSQACGSFQTIYSTVGIKSDHAVFHGPVTIFAGSAGTKDIDNRKTEESADASVSELVCVDLILNESPKTHGEDITVLLQPCSKLLVTLNLYNGRGRDYELKDVAKRGAILVYKNIYMYREDGFQIQAFTSQPEPNSDLVIWPESIIAGETFKKRKEFEKWILKNIHNGKLRPEAYSHTKNSSLHFVRDACDILGVAVPLAIQILLKRLLDIVRVMAERTLAASAESSARAVNALSLSSV